MARIRNLKPAFFKDEQLAELSPLHRLLFQGLWLLADKCGRLEDRPKFIKIEVLPYDKADVVVMLTDLEQAHFITRYEVGGRRYIEVRTFTKHQRISGDEAKAVTTIPAPCETQERSREEAETKQSGSDDDIDRSRDEASQKPARLRGGITGREYREGGITDATNVAPFPAPPDRPDEPHPVPRDAWLSLVASWNEVCETERSWTKVKTNLEKSSQGRLLRALRVTPNLDAWDARFCRAAASNHLTNRNGKGFVSTLWWLLDHIDELDAGQFDDRHGSTPVATGLTYPTADEGLAEQRRIKAETEAVAAEWAAIRAAEGGRS